MNFMNSNWIPAFAGMTMLIFSGLAHANPWSESKLNEITFNPPLGEKAPVDAAFIDEAGQPTTIRELAQGKTSLVVPVYHGCPMLCSLSLNGLLKATRVLRPTAGIDYTVIAVSIDPADTPAGSTEKRTTYTKGYSRTGADNGWRFVTGTKESIDALSRGIGFTYVFDEKSGEYGHGSALVVLSPEGIISRGLNGPEFEPKDLKLALIEASDGKIGTPVERALMYCYSFDGSTGRYSMEIMTIVRMAGAVTVLFLLIIILMQVRRERRRRFAMAGGAPL